MLARDDLYVRLLRFLLEESRGVRLRIVSLSLISGAARTAILIALNSAVAAAGTPDSHHTLLIAGFVVALLVYMATAYDSGVEREKLALTISRRMRLRLCDKLMSAHLRFLDSNNPGQVFAQIHYDIERISGATLTLIGAAQSSVLILCALAYLGWLSPVGLGLAISIALIGVATFLWLDHRTMPLVDRAREREGNFFIKIRDVLNGAKEVRLRRGRRDDLASDLASVTQQHLDLQVQVTRITTFTQLTSEACTFILIAAVVFLLGWTFAGGATSIFQFFSTILFIIGPLESLVSALINISRARVALRKIEELEASLDADIAGTSLRAIAPMTFRTIALRDVRFAFRGDNPDESFSVGPINLELHRGEVLFIVGGNGAGKTTLLKLLAGLYRPDSGSILVDGKPVEAADTQNYREMFAAVFSDFHLFEKLYGFHTENLEEFTRMLVEMQIASKTRLEGSTFTTVNLSSGQRKRLGYAVERLFDRQVYIFDEFSADQDPEFRRYFYHSIVPGLKRAGKSVVAVTHDDRWFDVADRLVKMDYGQVVTAKPQPHSAETAQDAAPARMS